MIPESWTPKVPMDRIIWHWTAGSYTPNQTDLKAYHFVIDGNGKWHRGVASIERNSGSLKTGYAAHTKSLNTGSIGVALACMAGAVESPFNAGKYPMKPEQIDSLVSGTIELARVYGIPITRRTMLSHAEVQPTLGVKQNQKWDFTRLPFDASLRGALVIGDHLRAMVEARSAAPAAPAVVYPEGATLRATARVATFSSETSSVSTGSLPFSTEVELLSVGAGRLQVLTPGGYKVWAPPALLELVDGPKTEDDTEPSDARSLIDRIRADLSALEQELGL